MNQNDKPRILAVDDSRVMRRAMSKVLGKEYDVVEAEHGEDAWTLLINDPSIQVVFTDLSMPYLDGFGLLERIRQADDPRLQELPVIIITGKDDDDATKQAALEKGASDFITKPFDSVQLQARARAHVRFEQTARKLDETSDRLEKQAAVDALTGLGGRRYFCKAAGEQLAYARRHGAPFILLRMDLDDFDRLFINLGKARAEEILRRTGQTLQDIVRKEDMVARVGLAKFAMLFRDAGMEEATDTARRILEGVNAMSFDIQGQTLRVTASIGLFEPALDADADIEVLIRETEVYLARAVEAGGNQVAVKSLRKIASERTISIPAALQLLAHGHEDAVRPHAQSLVSQILPLLDFLARNLEEPAAEKLETIRKRLADNG